MIFEDLLWFFIIYLVSNIIIVVIYRNNLGPFTSIFNWIGFIGVAIHELIHYLLCIILGVHVDNLKIRYRMRGIPSPHGSVDIKEQREVSFMQALIISLSPLIICTWLIFWSLSIIFNSSTHIFFKILAGILCISMLIGARPSSQDFSQIPKAFSSDSGYSFYQIFLLMVSIFLTYYLVILYQIIILDFLYYIIIAIFYFIFKYILMGLNKLFFLLKNKNGRKDLNFNLYTKNKIKLSKSYKVGNEDGQW